LKDVSLLRVING